MRQTLEFSLQCLVSIRISRFRTLHIHRLLFCRGQTLDTFRMANPGFKASRNHTVTKTPCH